MKRVRRMQDELRRAFLLYAIVPLLILCLFSAVLGYGFWSENILGRNDAARRQAAAVLEETVHAGLTEADRLADSCDFDRLSTDSMYRVQFYRSLYEFLSRVPEYHQFVVLDAAQNVVLSSRSQAPEFLPLSQEVSWGIVQRLSADPGRALYEFTGYERTFGQPWDLTAGCAVVDGGGVKGYVIFIASGSVLMRELVDARANIIVEDAFGHTPLCTDYNFSQRMSNKLQPRFHESEGVVHYGAGDYYVSREPVLSGEVVVYAITPLGELSAYLEQAGTVLLLTMLLLIGIVIYVSRRQAKQETLVIEQLIDAFAAARSGNLHYRLEIPETSELSIVGRSFNSMLMSLDDLMKESEQKTRDAVLLEVEQLTSQFDPHFLYNTLSNIRFMIKLRPQAAAEMTLALSRLLRYSIRHASAAVPLRDDMEYLYDYLAIMQYRFGERFDYSIHMAEESETALVPKLILQPLIENALKYGMEKQESLRVTVEIACRAQELVITITDNGPGIGAASLEQIRGTLEGDVAPSGHSGLYNVHRRIRLLYGEPYGLTVTSWEGEGTQLVMRLPLQADQGDEKE